MKFLETIKNRHSCREFQVKEIEEEKINQILETANSAPSAGNLQAYQIFLVKDKKIKEELANAAGYQEFIYQAPIVLVFMADPIRSAAKYGGRGERLYSIQDATIATAYAQLAATDLGLGVCWVGAFDEEEVKEILKAKEDLIPVSILPIGYPAEKSEITSRRDLDDLVEER